ncbi:hypothetical protein AB836_00670 [Rickettsiales bacterium (ex Bugula neritina AB1)]|nr:hypothetical protein AB836_00670 [Rickettsiales bacterium (ex Bugula neritina AB1)]
MSRKNKGSKPAKTVKILSLKTVNVNEKYEYHIRFNKKKKNSQKNKLQTQNEKTSLTFRKYNPRTRKHEKFVAKTK